MIAWRGALRERTGGYFACGPDDDRILAGVKRPDMDGGAREEFRFGFGRFVGEPIFAP